MKPIRLQLTNFLSYRDRVEVDFTGLHLACISGHNGAGKSTLLDAMTWALFGRARRTDDAIIFSGAEAAEVTFDFEYEEEFYRIQRRKSRSKTGVLDLFMRQQNEDGSFTWKSFTEKSMTMTEGSILRILRMDYDTFTNASFFLQGRADEFTQKNATDRKKILGSILGLDIWDVYNKKAAEKRKKHEEEQRFIDARISEIDTELGEEATRKTRYAELSEDLLRFSTQKKNLEDLLQNLRLSYNLQKELLKQLENNQNSLGGKRRAFEQAASLLAARKLELDEMQQLLAREVEIGTAFKQWKELRASLETKESLAVAYHKLREQKTAPYLAMENARSALLQEQKILTEKRTVAEQMLSDMPGKSAELQKDLQSIAAHDRIISHKSDKEGQRELWRRQREELSADNKHLHAQMDELQTRQTNLEGVTDPGCPFCGQDLTPDHRAELIRDILAEGKRLGDAYRQNQVQITELENSLRQVEGELQTITQLENEKQSLLRKTDGLQIWLNEREPLLKEWESTGKKRLAIVESQLTHETFAQEERALLTRLEAEIKQLNYDSSEHEDLRQRELTQRSVEIEYQQLDRTRSAIIPLQRQISDLDIQQKTNRQELEQLEVSVKKAEEDYHSQFADLPDLAQAELNFKRSMEQENILRDETAAARQKVVDLDTLRLKRKDLEIERELSGVRIGQYKQLERTFGKDGVPALLIEQAIPEIESEANDLLDRLSAGEMSVRFLTQRDYKDKAREGKKETLDIQISDGTSSRDYEMFSGGEAFRVNFAIRLALSRILAQRAGARLQTLVIDEGFGSQDAIGRQRLVEAINMVQNDFARILVITHLEELKDYFPSRIEVEKTENGSIVTVIAETNGATGV